MLLSYMFLKNHIALIRLLILVFLSQLRRTMMYSLYQLQNGISTVICQKKTLLQSLMRIQKICMVQISMETTSLLKTLQMDSSCLTMMLRLIILLLMRMLLLLMRMVMYQLKPLVLLLSQQARRGMKLMKDLMKSIHLQLQKAINNVQIQRLSLKQKLLQSIIVRIYNIQCFLILITQV